jgi:uncharacterized protein DUF3551
MTGSVRRIAVTASLLASAAIILLAPAVSSLAPAIAASGVPPFCVLRGGSDGPGSSPQLCAYFDYQACLQAAADFHGNCVQNIDYHGEVSTAPTAPRARHRR